MNFSEIALEEKIPLEEKVKKLEATVNQLIKSINELQQDLKTATSSLKELDLKYEQLNRQLLNRHYKGL